MKINIEKLDTFSVIEIENDCGFRVFLTDLGAGIYKIMQDEDVLNYGPEAYETYAKGNLYYGKTIARFAGRIKGANWGGVQYTPNEGNNLLHGGKYGLHDRVFKYRVEECKDFIKVVFKATDSGKRSKFPGTLNLTVIYKIFRNCSKFEINFVSKVSELSLVNLTNHAYFCLGTPDLNKLKLKINASNYVAVDNELIPTHIEKVDGIFDFRNLKRVTKDIYDEDLMNSRAHGYDHLWIFDTVNKRIPQIILKNSDYRMKIYTDFEATQIYANCYPGEHLMMVNGCEDGLFQSVAIEPQLNTFDISKTLQNPNEIRKNKITYVFESLKK